jgi:hypothetical protein
MMDNTEMPRSVLLIGVQDAGKSNFLFRLWLKLDLGNGILSKAALPPDLDYLSNGGEHLLKGEFAPRTPQDVHDKSEIPVKFGTDGNQIVGKLIVPDLPGEQILSVYRTRQWSKEWEDKIAHGCGCLMFIRVESKELIQPLDWVTCETRFGGPVADASPEKDRETERAKPPTQVVMVDWLQFLRKAFTAKAGGSYRPRVGIVVSAWDLAPEDQKPAGPEEWIKSNLPLLHQFAQTNGKDFEFAYFGVSVASGDFDAEEGFKSKYLSGDPRDAGEVVHSLTGTVETSGDVTLPVAWAMGLTNILGLESS